MSRNDYIGDRFDAVGGDAYVSGYGACNNDFIAATELRLTPVLALVMGLSLLLMLVAVRSVLLAVILTAFNALSVYGGYGLVVPGAAAMMLIDGCRTCGPGLRRGSSPKGPPLSPPAACPAGGESYSAGQGSSLARFISPLAAVHAGHYTLEP